MHYLKIIYYLPGDSEIIGYHVEAHCDWVSNYKDIAIFMTYEDAKNFAQRKAHEKGLEIVDEIEKKRKERKEK